MRSPDTACGCETKPSDQLLAFSLASPRLPETLPDGEAPLVVGANASGAGPPTAASAAVQLARRTAGFGPEWTRLAAHTSLRSEEHTSELQSLMRISYAVFCLKKKNTKHISEEPDG